MNATDSRKRSNTNWGYLASDSDKEIDFSDIPKLGPDFWRKATLRLPRKKESAALRLDGDILDWFRGSGAGYQTRINAVLRSYMQAVRKAQ